MSFSRRVTGIRDAHDDNVIHIHTDGRTCTINFNTRLLIIIACEPRTMTILDYSCLQSAPARIVRRRRLWWTTVYVRLHNNVPPPHHTDTDIIRITLMALPVAATTRVARRAAISITRRTLLYF